MRVLTSISSLAHAARDDERGATAVLTAATLTLLMGFAAIALDIGAGFNERRQDQSAADVAVLAAIQFASPGSGSTSLTAAMTNGANEAIAVANATLDNPALADWDACTDPGRPAEFNTVSPVTQCVSYKVSGSGTLQKARVRIPTINLDATFGRVIGTTTISTSAFAEAMADLGGAGKVLPFGLPVGSGGSHFCLRTAPQPLSVDPCNGPATGNFFTLDISLYGNETLGTQEACGPSFAQTKLAVNIAVGVDHDLVPWTAAAGDRHDHDLCPIFNAKPNQIPGQTGVGSNIDPGMVDGVSSLVDSFRPGRLARGSNRIVVESGSPTLDDTPLWSYLVGSGNIPAQCLGVADHSQMEACLDAWNPGHDPLFTSAIGNAVRFGAVPRLQGSFGPGKKDYRIAAIDPVYIQTTYWGCNATQCRIVHHPGEPSTGPCSGFSPTTCGLGSSVGGNNKLGGITAFLLDLGMLPADVRANFPGVPGQVVFNLTR
ncbi:MAG: pilus assembly protein TadG-related protein [Acidimicrobiia bacterium]